MSQPTTLQPDIRQTIFSLLAEFSPQKLLPSLTAGLITGLIGTIRSISYAALIFSGGLAVHLSVGVGMTVFSTAAVSLMVALTSALPGMIATPLTAPTVILAMMAANLMEEMEGSATSEEILTTVLVAIALSSFLTGSLLLVLGKLRLARLIRLIPYPVVGGFMAGTGWLLVRGSYQVMTDELLTWRQLSSLLQTDILSHWLVGTIFAVILLIVSGRFKHYLVMPGTLLAFVALFYLTIYFTSTPLEIARDSGWLLGPIPAGDAAGGLWHPVGLTELTQVDWGAIFSQSASIITIALVSLLQLVLNNSSIELSVGRDVNLNTELQAIGLANLASGFGSGMVGNQAFPSTMLVHKIGGNSRLTGIITSGFCVAVLVLGSSFLSFFPKPVLGSLLLYLGISLLIQWIYQGLYKFPLPDYLTVLIITIVINTVGFLQGIAVGFVIAAFLFMYNYSQVDIGSKETSGATTRSNVERTNSQSSLLAEQGERIYILQMQGFIFFGTANYLLNRVRNRIEDETKLSLRFVILDFKGVTGLDSSAVLSLNKILRIARKQQITLVFSNLSSEFQQELLRGGGLEINSLQCDLYPYAVCQLFPDIDRGLEWCENQLLNEERSQTNTQFISKQLEKIFSLPEQVTEFLSYLERQEKEAGDWLFREGQSDVGLYFLESGQVSVLLELPEGETKRLQTHTGFNILGEMRFFGKTPLSSSVVTDTTSILYYLSTAAFAKMKQEAPELTTKLQEFILGLLCDSLLRREEQLRVMQ